MKKVLIVDDEPNMLRVLKMVLERAGYEVRTACDGKAGLESLRTQTPDVLITDIQMPRMDGRELVTTVHRDMPDRAFEIYVMTSTTEREQRDWVDGIPGVHFLEKPVSPRQLASRLLARETEGACDADA